MDIVASSVREVFLGAYSTRLVIPEPNNLLFIIFSKFIKKIRKFLTSNNIYFQPF